MGSEDHDDLICPICGHAVYRDGGLCDHVVSTYSFADEAGDGAIDAELVTDFRAAVNEFVEATLDANSEGGVTAAAATASTAVGSLPADLQALLVASQADGAIDTSAAQEYLDKIIRQSPTYAGSSGVLLDGAPGMSWDVVCHWDRDAAASAKRIGETLKSDCARVRVVTEDLRRRRDESAQTEESPRATRLTPEEIDKLSKEAFGEFVAAMIFKMPGTVSFDPDAVAKEPKAAAPRPTPTGRSRGRGQRSKRKPRRPQEP